MFVYGCVRQVDVRCLGIWPQIRNLDWHTIFLSIRALPYIYTTAKHCIIAIYAHMIKHIYKRAFYKKELEYSETGHMGDFNVELCPKFLYRIISVIISYDALNIINDGRNMGQYSGAKVSKGPFCLEFA